MRCYFSQGNSSNNQSNDSGNQIFSQEKNTKELHMIGVYLVVQQQQHHHNQYLQRQ